MEDACPAHPTMPPQPAEVKETFHCPGDPSPLSRLAGVQTGGPISKAKSPVRCNGTVRPIESLTTAAGGSLFFFHTDRIMHQTLLVRLSVGYIPENVFIPQILTLFFCVDEVC